MGSFATGYKWLVAKLKERKQREFSNWVSSILPVPSLGGDHLGLLGWYNNPVQERPKLPLWFTPGIVLNIVLWLVGLALQIGGWTSHTIAYIIFGIAFVLTIAYVVYWLRHRNQMAAMPTKKCDIQIVYDDSNLAYRGIEGDEETFNVGLRIKTDSPVDNPVVFPTKLQRLSERGAHQMIPIRRLPLTPVGKSHSIGPGLSSLYFRVFKHRLSVQTIEFCYDGLPSKSQPFPSGTYVLTLKAEANPNSWGLGALYIVMDDDGNLSLKPWWEKEFYLPELIIEQKDLRENS